MPCKSLVWESKGDLIRQFLLVKWGWLLLESPRRLDERLRERRMPHFLCELHLPFLQSARLRDFDEFVFLVGFRLLRR